MNGVAFIDFETLPIVVGGPPPAPVGVALLEPGSAPTYLAFAHSSGNTSTPEEVRRRLKDLFTRYRIVAHNAAFELGVSYHHFRLVPQQFDDTLLLAFLDTPDATSLGLKSLAAALLGLPADEEARLHQWIVDKLPRVKGLKPAARISEVPGTLVADYAIGDVVRTSAIYELLRPRIAAGCMDDAYRRELDLIPVLLDMTTRGVTVDRERLARDLPTWQGQLKQMERDTRAKLGAGPGLNLNSSEQLANALEKAGVVDPSSWIRTPTGRRSAKIANLRTVTKDSVVLDLLDRLASLGTYVSTFAEPWLQMSEADGRLHANWNSTPRPGGGARTGRIVSSPNLQNIPTPVAGLPNLRDYLVPGDGRCFLDRDYSQQELRVLASYTTPMGGFQNGVVPLSERYRQNPELDVHEVARVELERITGTPINRDQAKQLNLAILYGMGGRSLAGKLGIDERQAYVQRCPRPRLPRSRASFAAHA